jgi:hypothetical protein
MKRDLQLPWESKREFQVMAVPGGDSYLIGGIAMALVI